MMPRLGGVTLSVLLHAGLIVLLLAWSTAEWARPLFVDLVETAASPGAPARTAGTAPSRPAARGAAPAAVARRPEPSPVTPAPAPPSAAAPPGAAPPAAPSPMEHVVIPAPPPPSPAAPLAPPSAAAAVEQRPGAPTADPGPVAPSGEPNGAPSEEPALDDAASGPGGGPGSPLALATPGGSGGPPPQYGPYLRRFRERVLESLVYPLAARRQGVGGTVELLVWLEATGRVRDVRIARSSSHRVLDDAAVETIRRLGPVPFPDSLPRRPLMIRIPLVYELR